MLNGPPPAAPAAPAETTTPATQSPPQTLEAQLDDVMAQAEIAANAQRDEEAGIPPVSTPTRQEAPSPPAEGDGSEGDDDELVDEEDDSAGASPAASPAAPEAPAETPSTTSTAPETPKYTRRDAARFAEQAQLHEREAAEARQIAERAQAELNAARASDQHILTQLAEVSGFVVEANGRTQYANLSDKVLSGTASDAERKLVAEMKQWHELAKPIYRQAELQVSRAFATDWNALKDLDGVGDKGLTKLNAAANSVAGARELHAMAYAAGQAKAKADSEATIARLRAELKSAKTNSVVHAPQPAVTNGAAVPSGSLRDRMLNPDGSIREDFDREVRAGKWLGADLSSA